MQWLGTVPRNGVFTVGVAIALAVLSHRAVAQDVYVTLVHTHLSVTDAQGRLVTTLGRADFTVYDNDVAQGITDFGLHVDAPLSVAVLLDRSQSVSSRFPFLTSAAEMFASAMLRRPEDRGLLVAFDSKVYLLQDWTADSTRLVQDIGGLTAAGGTSIFDAVFKTCRDKFDPDGNRQNAVVLVTDGEDTTSLATFDQALEMAAISRASVYVVGVPSEGSLNTRELQGRTVLSKLADLTGGRLFYPEDQAPGSLDSLFARVRDELRAGTRSLFIRISLRTTRFTVCVSNQKTSRLSYMHRAATTHGRWVTRDMSRPRLHRLAIGVGTALGIALITSGCAWQTYAVTRAARHFTGAKTREHIIGAAHIEPAGVSRDRAPRAVEHAARPCSHVDGALPRRLHCPRAVPAEDSARRGARDRSRPGARGRLTEP